jgi:hypothetical protein
VHGPVAQGIGGARRVVDSDQLRVAAVARSGDEELDRVTPLVPEPGVLLKRGMLLAKDQDAVIEESLGQPQHVARRRLAGQINALYVGTEESGHLLKGDHLPLLGSLGKPRTVSPIMLRCTSEVPA